MQFKCEKNIISILKTFINLEIHDNLICCLQSFSCNKCIDLINKPTVFWDHIFS